MGTENEGCTCGAAEQAPSSGWARARQGMQTVAVITATVALVLCASIGALTLFGMFMLSRG